MIVKQLLTFIRRKFLGVINSTDLHTFRQNHRSSRDRSGQRSSAGLINPGNKQITLHSGQLFESQGVYGRWGEEFALCSHAVSSNKKAPQKRGVRG